MGVPKFTTPTFTLTFSEQTLDLRNAQNVYVTFLSGDYCLTKTGEDLVISEKSIGVRLSQEETGNFKKGEVKIQANWTINGNRVASEIAKADITDQLLAEVIT